MRLFGRILAVLLTVLLAAFCAAPSALAAEEGAPPGQSGAPVDISPPESNSVESQPLEPGGGTADTDPAESGRDEQPLSDSGGANDDSIDRDTLAESRGDGVSGYDMAGELLRLLKEDAGGEITLTGDAVWNAYDEITVTRSVTVRMGSYGILIPAGRELRISGPVKFEGTGNPAPLLRVEGYMRTGRGVEIAAEGDCAVAVEMVSSEEEGMGSSRHGFWEPEFTSVYVRGKDAAAVASSSADLSLSLEYARLEARGENAVGVRAEGPVSLTACEVLSDGEAVISGGDIVLDVCRVSPAPPNAQIVRRRAEPVNRILQNGISVAVTDEAPEMAMGEYGEFTGTGFRMIDVDGVKSYVGFSTGAKWENIPQDWSVPGSHTITCVPDGIPAWLPVEGVGSFELPFHIVGENQPHITDAHRFGADGVMLRFFREIIDAETIALMVSDDGGASWRNVEEIEGSLVSPFNTFIEALPPNRDYMFRLEVTGGRLEGVSNILNFPYYDTDSDREGGGDRDDDNYQDGEDSPPKGVSPQEKSRGGEESPGIIISRSGESPVEDSGEPALDKAEETASVAENPVVAPPERKPALSISGPALSDRMLAYPSGLTVTERGIKAVFSPRLLDGIELFDGEELSVLLERPDELRFLVRLLAGAREITDFKGESFFIHVEYGAAEENIPYIRCENASGTSVSANRYEGGRLVFELFSTGEYRIIDNSPVTSATAATAPPRKDSSIPAVPDAGEKPGIPLIPAAVCGLFSAAAATAALYLRNRGRRGT